MIGNREIRTGVVVGLVNDRGRSFACLDFMGTRHDSVSVPTKLLEAAGVHPVTQGTWVTAAINPVATEEVAVNPTNFSLIRGE